MKKISHNIFLFTLLLSSQCIANERAEAEKLQQLIKHLEASKAIIHAARSNANPNKRLQFDFETLTQNINDMQQGIAVYLQKPLEPRAFDELPVTFSDYN